MGRKRHGAAVPIARSCRIDRSRRGRQGRRGGCRQSRRLLQPLRIAAEPAQYRQIDLLQRAHQHHDQRPRAGPPRRRLDLYRGPRLGPRHRQIRLRPEEGHRPDRRFHVQGRDALRRRQDLQERRRREGEHAGWRARHSRRHVPDAGERAKGRRLFPLWRFADAGQQIHRFSSPATPSTRRAVRRRSGRPPRPMSTRSWRL